MSSEEAPRSRRRKQAGSGDQEDLGKEALAEAIKDPLVRTAAKPPDESKVDEQWDLEDDEDWVDGQTPKEKTDDDIELGRRRRILKRDSTEVGIAFVVHLALMCAYIYIHVYDATIVKRNKGEGFDGLKTYGGRWKFLSYINLWVQFIYFFLCFFTDIMPWSSMKYMFLKACDIMFTTVCVPMSMFVVLMFWGIYAVDREMVHPAKLDSLIPPFLNHCAHTFPILAALLEALIVFHRYPKNFQATAINFAVTTLYIIWIVWVFTQAGIWPYPFFRLIPLPGLPLFFLANFLIILLLYHMGKQVYYFRWKERHDLLEEMGL